MLYPHQPNIFGLEFYVNMQSVNKVFCLQSDA